MLSETGYRGNEMAAMRVMDVYRAVHVQGFLPIFVADDRDSKELVEAAGGAAVPGVHAPQTGRARDDPVDTRELPRDVRPRGQHTGR